MTRERIRILHVLHSFSAGGLENGVVNIINGSGDRFDHELCLLSSGHEFLERLKVSIPCHVLSKRPGNDPRVLAGLWQLFRERRPHIVHTRNWSGFDGVVACCLRPGPALVHGEHGRDLADPQGLNTRRNWLRRLLAFRVTKFVAVTGDLKRWLHETVGIPEGKLLLIPNGVDTGKFAPNRNPGLRAALGIREDEPVVGSIGRLDPVKNFPGLIRAAQRLNQQGIPARLLIVGDGPQRPLLETMIQNLNWMAPPILVGYQSDPKSFYGIFDVFVLNSFAEGMSNTLMEAMASGLAIVCTAVGGNTELVENEVRGRHVPPDDEEALANRIAQYLESSSLRQEHGRNSRNFVEHDFSLAAMVERYARLYEGVLS